ncbi:inactive peptidyl-prolyl cis-trans isomerase shutdown-like [Pectinophora gossypiella]|uniref:inactive peptidyl-prolyl cis-trans isomerase shutdown-like n=1 Tax=Pectinophora gossypiella TaxID=13191 RepID=UPI00214E28CF|nr:inactive peptidyl-prolyl cis-trans isomerase shutdown-like [Pectinophora gossypiella]
MDLKPSIALEDGLDLKQILTTGSTLKINADYDESEIQLEPDRCGAKTVDFIGCPVKSFAELEKQLTPVDAAGFVKKKILEEGGGFPLHRGCTVHVAFSGYWENDPEPFDVTKSDKPLIVDMNDSGLLPGLQMAIESMLVGEMSVFLLTYLVMYGELGIPPRIKPKANCVFYVKLIKSTVTPKEKLDLREPNVFDRVYHEVKMLYASGAVLYKSKNFPAAIQLFRKAIFMLHKCRLADENEEQKQEKMLLKLYTNLAVCYNIIKQPQKACIACNELNRLNNLWNNGKVLFQNAKALRMIGEFDGAEKRLRRAMKLCPDRRELEEELQLIQKTRESCNQSKLIMKNISNQKEEASHEFKREVDNLIKNFKENSELFKLTIPGSLNDAEKDYIREACVREHLLFNKVNKDYALDKEERTSEASEDTTQDSNEDKLYDELGRDVEKLELKS